MVEDTKKCPFCAEEIKIEAKICRFCKKNTEKPLIPVASVEQQLDTKKCPFCAEEIKIDAKICRFCKHYFEPMNEAILRRGSANSQFNFEANKKSPLIAALLNLVVPGLGYMYCGYNKLGIAAFFFVIIFAIFSAGLFLICSTPIMIIDGILCASRANRNLEKKLLADREGEKYNV